VFNRFFDVRIGLIRGAALKLSQGVCLLAIPDLFIVFITEKEMLTREVERLIFLRK
jgi:hypothetical protein